MLSLVVVAKALGRTAGGWSSVNVTDQGVQNASMFAVSALAQQDNSLFLYQLGSILQASSQVVQGTNYNITLAVQLTNCSSNSTSIQGCTATSQETCVMIVWYRSWMTPPMILTSSSCSSWTSLESSSMPTTSSPVVVIGGLPGGWRNFNVTDQTLQNISIFAVSQLALQRNSLFLYQVGYILQSSSQVVSGINYNITLVVQMTNCSSNSTSTQGCMAMSQETCGVIVWYRSWMTPSMILTSSSCTSWTSLQSSGVSTTSSPGIALGGLPGGWNNVNVTDQVVQNASMFAVGQLALQRNSLFLYQLGSILQASSQVVQGTTYNITLIVQLTNCSSNTGTQGSGSCTATSQETCVVIVWYRSWLTPPMILTNSSCSSWSSPPPWTYGGRGLLGAYSSANTSDPGVQNASVFAVGELARQSNSQFLFRVGSILQASSQVVQGTNYNITLIVQMTNCSSNSTGAQNSSVCTTTRQETCVVIVWVQYWGTPGSTLTSSSCFSWIPLQAVPGSSVPGSSTNKTTYKSTNGSTNIRIYMSHFCILVIAIISTILV